MEAVLRGQITDDCFREIVREAVEKGGEKMDGTYDPGLGDWEMEFYPDSGKIRMGLLAYSSLSQHIQTKRN